MKDYIFGDFKAEIDATDADFVARYEQAGADYNIDIQAMPEGTKESEKLLYVCDSLDKCFVKIFGSDAPKALFGESKSAGKRTDAFVQLIDTIKSDTAAADKLTALMPNRAARRAKA